MSNRLPPNYYDNEIVSMYVNQGMQMHRIADELGIAVGKVYNRLKICGVKSRDSCDYPLSDESRRKIAEAGRRGKGRKRSEDTRRKLSEAKFKGGIGYKKKRSDGYIAVYFPDHPCASKDGHVMEHILVVEAVVGRHLYSNECVHHLNGKRDDNRANNLLLMTSSDHMSYHSNVRYGNIEKAEAILDKYKKGVMTY